MAIITESDDEWFEFTSGLDQEKTAALGSGMTEARWYSTDLGQAEKAERRAADTADRTAIEVAWSADNSLEDQGMHANDRVTCYTDRAWADHSHDLHGRRVEDTSDAPHPAQWVDAAHYSGAVERFIDNTTEFGPPSAFAEIEADYYADAATDDSDCA